jgi:hypothetical protein
MLTILIAVCKVARASDYGFSDELLVDVDSVIERAQAELESLSAESLGERQLG